MPLRYLDQRNPRNRTYTFQRRWPTALAPVAKAAGKGAMFRCPTSCPVNGTAFEQAKAQEAGLEEYAKAVKELEYLEQHRPSDGIVIGAEGIPEAIRNAMMRSGIHKVKKSVGKIYLLSDVFAAFLAKHKLIGKALVERQRHWDNFMRHCDNIVADESAITTIHKAFDSWQSEQEDRGLAPSSIQRTRNSVAKVFNWWAVEQRLNWMLRLKPVGDHKAKAKPVLTQEEQRRLLDLVVTERSPTSAMAALMLAGGVMPSEISRLDPPATVESLSNELPYVMIGATGNTKTEARRRIVPVVWSPEVVAVMREQLPVVIDRASKAADSSATVNKWLRTRGFNTTGHGLRHTLRAVAEAAVGNSVVIHRVGGWTGGLGLNDVMLSYGGGVADSELLRGLTEEVSRWWKHLL